MKEIPEITGMRGYASLGVVVFHLVTVGALMKTMWIPSFILSWNSGVDFFFVLSGFLLSAPFMAPARVVLKVYYTRRIFRIFPVYYLSIAICGSLLLLSNYATVQQVLASLFFVQSLSPSTFNSINGVNWTLVIEEIFYVTLPILAVLFKGERWKFSLPACVSLSLAYRVAVVNLYPGNALAFHLWQYPSFLGHFALGLTLANFYVNKKMPIGKSGSSAQSILVASGLVASQYAIGSIYSIGNNVAAFPGIVFAFEYSMLIYSVLTSPSTSRIRLAFANRAAVFAGKISYSTYTWHLPIEVGLLQLGLPSLEWALVSVASAMLLATWSFRNLETRFLMLRDRFLLRSGLVQGHVAASYSKGRPPSSS
jgi:peptidoglycan/LPS O-acetylase OafA/YrhL